MKYCSGNLWTTCLVKSQDPDVFPSPVDTFASARSSSRRLEKSTASVNDPNYRDFLHRRNIFIETEGPPSEFMLRARSIISRERESPEMDESTAQKLRDTIRQVQNEGEDEMIRQLAPFIIPAINILPDQRLACSSYQMWYNAVPVTLNSKILISPLPLPKPKPCLAFGHSPAAFNEEQLATIDLLVDDHVGRSYAIPDQKLQFPFFNVEFKSQAKNGTLYVAENQVAGAGAIAMNANLELVSRSLGLESFDFDQPQFFSVTLDHKMACVNVHWIGNRADEGQYSFHLEELSTYLLKDENGVRALRHAIKNILDYGSDTRPQHLCDALDAYRNLIIVERDAATLEKKPGNALQAHAASERPRRSKRAQRPPHNAGGGAAASNETHGADGAQDELQTGPRSRRKQAPSRQLRERNQAEVPHKIARARRIGNAGGG